MSTQLNNVKKILGMKPSLDMGIITITPDMATSLMKFNTNNRSISKNRLVEYTDAMSNGNFSMAESVIGFNHEGILTNGQTRLQACINSGKPFTTMICTVLEQNMHIDTGRSRSVSQNMILCNALDGIIIPSSNSINTVSELLRITNGNKRVSPELVVSFCKIYGCYIDDAYSHNLFDVDTSHRELCKRFVTAAFLAAAINGVDIDEMAYIRDILTTGISNSKDDKLIISLRDKLIKASGHNTTSEKHSLFLMTQDCIYNVVNNKHPVGLKACERYGVQL